MVCMFRILAIEIHSLGLRIQAIRANSLIRFGYSLPSFREIGQRQLSLREEGIVLRACSHDIRKLHTEHPWMGPLDQQVAAQAFCEGLKWGVLEMNSAFGDGMNNEELIERLAEAAHGNMICANLICTADHHPCLTPYASLPETDKKKVRAFVGDIPLILKKAGFELVYTFPNVTQESVNDLRDSVKFENLIKKDK